MNKMKLLQQQIIEKVELKGTSLGCPEKASPRRREVRKS